MDKNKFARKIIILFVLFISICTLSAQENKLFKEYLHLFTEVHLADTYQNYDTISIKIPFIKTVFLNFLDKEIQDTIATSPWIVFKTDKYYLAILSYQIEDFFVLENNKYYYYFIFYDKVGNIINSYKLLASSEQQDSKLFFNKNTIKYLLYGPYVEKSETNCKEVIYEITNNNSLKQVSEQTYKVKRKDLFVW
jgi:hypothetical protein